MTDFVYDLESKSGDFDFSRTIPLEMNHLLEERNWTQLSDLVERLIRPAREQQERGAAFTSVMDVSDYLGLLKSRRFFWKEFIQRAGTLFRWADEVRPYAVRDLRRAR